MTTSSSERGVSLGMPQLPAPAYPDDVRARLETDAREVVAHIHPDHAASARVATRAGLLPTPDQVDGEQVWRLPGQR